MKTHVLLLEYVRFDPAKLKARLEDEANYLTGNDTRDLTLLKARLIHWTKPGDERFPKWLQQFDPSPNNKYVNWMITRYLQGGIKRLEDFGSGIVQALKRFEELKNAKKLGADADINKLKGLSDLNTLVASFDDSEPVTKAEKVKDVKIILNSPNYSIVSPNSYEASKALACDTDWCTAFPDMYRHYSKQGPLYIITDKKTNDRWQFHFESNQFMDEKDSPLEQDNASTVQSDFEVSGLITFLTKHAEVANAFAKLGKFKIEGDSWIFSEKDGLDETTGFKAYDKHGLYHRDPNIGPAVVNTATESHTAGGSTYNGPTDGEGIQMYYVHGERHREDGPAYIHKQGNLEIEKWYNRDILTRDPEDGPAMSTYLDTETGEIDPDLLDTSDPEEAAGRYERRYDYYVNGEHLGNQPNGGPLGKKKTGLPSQRYTEAEDAQYEAELAEMLSIAGINPQQLAARNTIENKSKSAAEKSRFQAENKVQPGTDEWFRLWFARPDLTGENPFG